MSLNCGAGQYDRLWGILRRAHEISRQDFDEVTFSPCSYQRTAPTVPLFFPDIPTKRKHCLKGVSEQAVGADQDR